MDAKIFRINYKSDFILTLESDAGWMTPFCIKFWTGAPSQAYFVGWDGETYDHCSFDPSEPTKLQVQFDDHHLPIGDLKFQVAYHFTVADFPNDTEDEVINPANITTEIDGETYQVMLDFTGETAPEIQFALPAYANEAQRIANEQQRIANEQTRLQNEQQRIQQDNARVQEFGNIQEQADADHRRAESDHGVAVDDHTQAGNDHTRAESDHGVAVDDHTQAGNDHTRAESDHGIAVDDHTQAGNDHTRAESDHSVAVDDHTQAGNDHTRAESDHGIAVDDHTQAGNDHTRAESDHTRAESDHDAVELYVDSLGVFDLSKHNAVGGVLATYASLSAALTALNALESKYKYGGMSFKYVDSSDNNKYVQYRLMSDSFNTTVANWQGVDGEIKNESKNLAESGAVASASGFLTDTHLGIIDSNNNWANLSSGRRYYMVIPIDVTGGETITIKGAADGLSSLALLSAYNPVEGETASVLKNITVNANAVKTDTIPVGTKFLYILAKSYSENRIPQVLTIDSVDIIDWAKNSLFPIQNRIKAAELKETNDISSVIQRIDNSIDSVTKRIEDEDLLGRAYQGYIATDEWADIGSGSRYYNIIPADSLIGETLFIKAMADNTSAVAFLSDYNPVSGASADIIGSIISLSNSEETIALIPVGTKYIYVLNSSFNSIRLPQVLKTESLNFLGMSKDNIFSLEKEIKVKVNIADESLVNKTATVGTSNVTLFNGPIRIRKGDLIQLSISGQGVIWSRCRVYINGSYANPFEILVNSGKILCPFDIDSLWLQIRSEFIITQGNVSVILTRYNFNSLLSTELESTNFVKPNIYRGYIDGDAWKDIDGGIRWYRIFNVPGVSGQVHIVTSENSATSVFFLSKFSPIEGSTDGIISGVNTPAGTDTYIEIPTGTNYIYLLCWSGSETRMPTTLKIGAIDLLTNVPANLINVYEELKNAVPVEGTGILDFNPSNDVLPKVLNLDKAYRTHGASTPLSECLVLLYFSDAHSDNTNLGRINDFAEAYDDYIDDVISTGDMLGLDLNTQTPTNINPNWLEVIGNHDASLKVDGNWVIQPSTSSYNKLIAPFVSNWNVVQPSDAAVDGKCYYYKDYSSQKVRLIVLDCYVEPYTGVSEYNHWNDAQKTWFEGVLADTLDENNAAYGYHVIVAVHYPAFLIEHDADITFDTVDFTGLGQGICCVDEIPAAVRAFKTNGGKFICYLTGHIHSDMFGLGRANGNYTDQLCISISCASVNAAQPYGDQARSVGNKTQDCFDLLSVDTGSSTLKLMRIGAEYDRTMRWRNVLSWDYENNQLIYCN